MQPPLNIAEQVQAFCYLHEAGDEHNKCWLTNQRLIVNRKKKLYFFELVHIQGVFLESRKAMLYLLLGGIGAPLTLTALFSNLINPWLAIILVFAGIFSLYYGWLGYQVLSIQDFVSRHDLTLHEVSPNLKAFVNFVIKALPINRKRISPQEKMIYHICDSKSWLLSVKEGVYWPQEATEGFIHASDHGQVAGTRQKYFQGKQHLLLITIDPLKVDREIRYEDLSGEGQLFPHIYGPLNTNAIVRIENL